VLLKRTEAYKLRAHMLWRALPAESAYFVSEARVVIQGN